MGSREDDEYWLTKYDLTPECEVCWVEMYYDNEADDWRCSECEEIERTVKYG